MTKNFDLATGFAILASIGINVVFAEDLPDPPERYSDLGAYLQEGEIMPDPARPPALPVKKKQARPIQIQLNPNLERDRATIKKGIRDDHPAIAAAKRRAKTSETGGEDAR